MVGAGLLANAAGQSAYVQLMYRIREQVRSHIWRIIRPYFAVKAAAIESCALRLFLIQ
jgi:hypothetical protein